MRNIFLYLSILVYFMLFFSVGPTAWFVLLFFINLFIIHLGFSWGIRTSLVYCIAGCLFSVAGMLKWRDMLAVGLLECVLFLLSAAINALFYFYWRRIRLTSSRRFTPLSKSYRDLRRSNLRLRKDMALLQDEIEGIILLYQLSQELGSDLSLDEVLRSAARFVRRVLKLDNLAIFLWDDPRREFVKVIEDGFVVIPSSFEKLETETSSPLVLEFPGGYNFFLPLRVEGRTRGWMISRNKENTFSGIIEEGAIIADQIAMGISRADLYKRVEQMSRTDDLTGLYRKHYFMDRLEQEVLRGKRYKTEFSLLMIDIDHFKKFNDTYGHPVGDELLKGVAKMIKKNIYDIDILGRYGGDEFSLLLPIVGTMKVLQKAQDIRQKVESREFLMGQEKIRLTISIGIAHFPVHAESGERLLESADKALYTAKQEGRNRVVEFR